MYGIFYLHLAKMYGKCRQIYHTAMEMFGFVDAFFQVILPKHQSASAAEVSKSFSYATRVFFADESKLQMGEEIEMT